MAKGLKYNNYVGVRFNDGTMRFVTELDNASRIARWGEGVPKKFTQATAKHLVFGLSVNGYQAFVCTTLYDLEYQEPLSE